MQELAATTFPPAGDRIVGWYWLRDEGLQHTAEWAFVGVPAGSEDSALASSVLATDRANGGRGFPARFRLIYGFPACNKESIVILSPALRLTTAPVGRSNLSSTGDYILGASWCRKVGHALDWAWDPILAGATINEAAINLTLLVTNTFDGGSGVCAVIPVTVLNLEGKVIEPGTVELTNTFRPRFRGNSKGLVTRQATPMN